VIELLDDRFLKKEQQFLFPREWDDVEITDKSTLSKKLTDFWKKLVQ
jgi:hypothetical protein